MFNDCYSRSEEIMREPPLPLYLYSVGEKTLAAGEISEMGSLKNNFAELIWGVEGTGELTLYGKTFSLHPDDIFFYLPGEAHRHLALSERWRTRWITFDGPLAEAYLMSFRYPRLLRGGTVPSNAIFEDLKKTIADPDWEKIRKNTGVLCQTLANLAIGNLEIAHSGELVKQCMDFILSRLAEPELDLQMICDSLHVTQSNLNRLFREELGVAPGRFIQDRRLQEAQVLLLNTNLTVKELAARCGFTDPNTFNRFIRRNMGMSPITYRKKNIKKKHP